MLVEIAEGLRSTIQRRGRTRCAAGTVHAEPRAPSNARPRAQFTWEPALILRPTAAAGLPDEVARRARLCRPMGSAEGEKASEERRKQRPANRKCGDEIRNGGSVTFSVGSTRVVARARPARGR